MKSLQWQGHAVARMQQQQYAMLAGQLVGLVLLVLCAAAACDRAAV